VPIGAPVAALTGAGYMTAAFGLGDGARIVIAALMLAVSLFINVFGMKLAGSVQIVVVSAIVLVLILAISGSFPHMEARHFTPFMPEGWISVGQSAAILFWCFIGWEAVSHLSEEFVDPKRAAVQGVTVAAIIVGVLYFLTALATVGTHSYGGSGSDVSLLLVIEKLLGPAGAVIAGLTGMFICTATVISYTGASSRLAYALAREGKAPAWMGKMSSRFQTPVGGLGFLAGCFVLVLVLYGTGAVSLTTLITLPNATFILTYLGGCAAGIRLLKGQRWGRTVSWLSFILTAAVFPFVGWAILYPLVICGVYFLVSIGRKNKAQA
ncbi:amino acid permease, partial [Paenibacillus sp. AR247]